MNQYWHIAMRCTDNDVHEITSREAIVGRRGRLLLQVMIEHYCGVCLLAITLQRTDRTPCASRNDQPGVGWHPALKFFNPHKIVFYQENPEMRAQHAITHELVNGTIVRLFPAIHTLTVAGSRS